MNYLVTKITVICLMLFFTVANAQNHADCVDAIPACFGKMPINSTLGEGNYEDFQPIGPMSTCLLAEENSTYFSFYATDGGYFGFEIQPGNSQTDYDWAVFDIATTGCSGFENFAVAANTSGGSGNTGPNGMDTSFCNGMGAGPYAPRIPIVSGHKYLIYVSNYSQTYNGDSIDFTFSDSAVFSVLPAVVQTIDTCTSGMVNLHCGYGDNYLWSIGDTTNEISVSTSGLYTVDYSNACGTFNDSFLVNLTAIPNQSFLPPDMSFCHQDSAIIFPIVSFPSYFWHYNGSSIMPDTLYTGGEYIVHATDTNMCTYFDTLHVYFSSEIYNPSICAASVNNNLAGVELFYKKFPNWMPMSRYDIYKYDNSGSSFQLIATQYPPNTGYYFDAGAGLTKRENYYIIATDTCSNSNYDSLPQNSIYLKAEYQNPTASYLTWSVLQNANVLEYYIYAGNSPSTLSHVQTNLASDTGTVVAYLTQDAYFQIVALVENNNFCSIDSVYSNMQLYMLGEEEMSTPICFVDPNPVEDCFHLEGITDYNNVLIYSSDGQIIKSMKKASYYCVNDLTPGFYVIQVVGDNKKLSLKIIKQ